MNRPLCRIVFGGGQPLCAVGGGRAAGRVCAALPGGSFSCGFTENTTTDVWHSGGMKLGI
ncbi:hypothetical protein ACQXZL_09695 [Corynebacterium diphtheriae]|uniref:Uncharacterized protein n=1 Tax=Corynebacterium diphtheriae bv. gravis TaxID=1720349 RepID=A0AAX0J1W2_CORDP|nr:hypothetical protein [Corynebacterium diphtheriae]ERA50312.1 putative secreted protein [Corynebacterium diphtheriae DSM 43988]AEX42774.1 putative secreted protein [Corynebacterium diphtheriae 31A]AEX47243.1 putative secreted protein [Corynebacterium diphtheriae INCA 402]AEX68253.1 putative secreted protein [Corynebacterium diphtheriae C7 (beta)]APM36167.1 hypothetical protein BS112_06470 [Corynebacterium diphtheriae]